MTESGSVNARKAFSRLERSIRKRVFYRNVYEYSKFLRPKPFRGLIELNEFGGRFADLKRSVAEVANDEGFKLLTNSVNAKGGWRAKKEILLGRSLSFEHLAFSTPRLEHLLSGLAVDGLAPHRLADLATIKEIETILENEIEWLNNELRRNKVKVILLHDDQRPAPALLCTAARKAGTQTVTVSHGYTGWSQAYSSRLPLKSDHFIVWSDFEAQRIHDLYPEYRGRVHSFGFPGLEEPMDALHLGRPPSDQRVLTYICGPIWFMKERFGADVSATLWEVRKAVEAAGYEFVVRLHWQDRRRAPAAETARLMDEFQTSSNTLVQDFQRSSAIAASYVSSALLEAAAYGRKAINITEGTFEVPWAENVSIVQLTECLIKSNKLNRDQQNAFRTDEFNGLLKRILTESMNGQE